jgi:hypothetical protein
VGISRRLLSRRGGFALVQPSSGRAGITATPGYAFNRVCSRQCSWHWTDVAVSFCHSVPWRVSHYMKETQP